MCSGSGSPKPGFPHHLAAEDTAKSFTGQPLVYAPPQANRERTIAQEIIAMRKNSPRRKMIAARFEPKYTRSITLPE